jgi:hypothetical protein
MPLVYSTFYQSAFDNHPHVQDAESTKTEAKFPVPPYAFPRRRLRSIKKVATIDGNLLHYQTDIDTKPK